MTRKLIPARELHRKWMRDTGYAKAYKALEGEFALISEIIKARASSGLTQDELANRMGTTRTAIARLESGRQMPSTRTLERFAEATGHRLRITFERVGRARKGTGRAAQ